MRRIFRPLLCSLALCALPGLARGEVVTFTQTFVADFSFTFPANSPFNMTGTDSPPVPFEAVGALSFTIDPSINDPGLPTTVPITGFTGSLAGISPVGGFPFTIDPNVQFVGGSLTNIVRDSAGEVTSADITDLSAYWELFAPTFRLYGDTPLVFNGHIGGLPLQEGDTIAGPAPFNVYLDLGLGLGNDPLAAIGSNRTLTARTVPEPGGLALIGVGTLSLLAVARRRSTRD